MTGILEERVDRRARTRDILSASRGSEAARRVSARERNEISERCADIVFSKILGRWIRALDRRAGQGGQTNRYSTGFVKSTKLFR